MSNNYFQRPPTQSNFQNRPSVIQRIPNFQQRTHCVNFNNDLYYNQNYDNYDNPDDYYSENSQNFDGDYYYVNNQDIDNYSD